MTRFEQAVKRTMKAELIKRGNECANNDKIMTQLTMQLCSMNTMGWSDKKLVGWYMSHLDKH